MLFWSLFLLTLLIRESQFIDTPIKPESKNNSGDVLRTTLEDEFVCPTENKTCTRYKRLKKTKDLACYSSKDCDLAFVCCPDSCYKHRICKNKTELQISLKKKSARMSDDLKRPLLSPFELVEGKVETCPSEKSPCAKPQDAKKTERFKCVDQCPPHYKCCNDSCFAHKICKKANVTITKVYVQTPKHRINHSDSESTTTMKPLETTQKSPKPKNESEVTTAKPVTTQQPPLVTTDKQDAGECPAENLVCSTPLHENDTKQFDCDKRPCPKDFFCCKDNCFTHKICKEPSSSNGSGIRFSRKREVCPAEEESCLLPADIKNAVFCAKENCTSGLKCCPDACFKRNVCKKPDIIIETTIETCPEEPKVCDSFLRSVTIHPRYICSVNMSNCPDETKCCSDSCHQADLCKKPDVHTVVQKLVPITTYQEESQTPGNKTGASEINGSQTPGNKPVASEINGSQTPGNKPDASETNGSQTPGNKPGASEINGSQTPGNKPGVSNINDSQTPGNKPAASNINDSPSPGSNAGATASQPANGQQPPVSNPGASTGQLVTASPNTTYKDDLQSPDSHESAESPDDHMLT